jgi:hypothetical protein
VALALYAERLNLKRLQADNACVWPSNGLTASYLGCSEREVRRINKTLEAGGYLIRDYNRANRPAGREAFDLAPLVARLHEIESVSDAIRDAQRARRQAYQTPIVHDHFRAAQTSARTLADQSADQPCIVSETAEQPTAVETDTTPQTSLRAPAARPAVQHDTARTGVIPDCKGPQGADSSRLGDELATAMQICPALAEHIPQSLLIAPQANAQTLIACVSQAAQALLPDPERNNGETARWGFARHGARIIVLLAVALKDPTVRNRCAYFGRLATWDASGSLDLRLNLNRILRNQTGPAAGEETPAAALQPFAPAMAIEREDHPTWVTISTHLRLSIREGAFGSWFGRVGFISASDDNLHLTTPNKIAADHIRKNFVPALIAASKAAGQPVRQVSITVRPASPPLPLESQS